MYRLRALGWDDVGGDTGDVPVDVAMVPLCIALTVVDHLHGRWRAGSERWRVR